MERPRPGTICLAILAQAVVVHNTALVCPAGYVIRGLTNNGRLSAYRAGYGHNNKYFRVGHLVG